MLNLFLLLLFDIRFVFIVWYEYLNFFFFVLQSIKWWVSSIVWLIFSTYNFRKIVSYFSYLKWDFFENRWRDVFNGKFLGTSEIWRNDILFSHVHNKPYHEFNEWILSWIWKEEVPFSILREYLRITHFQDTIFFFFFIV